MIDGDVGTDREQVAEPEVAVHDRGGLGGRFAHAERVGHAAPSRARGRGSTVSSSRHHRSISSAAATSGSSARPIADGSTACRCGERPRRVAHALGNDGLGVVAGRRRTAAPASCPRRTSSRTAAGRPADRRRPPTAPPVPVRRCRAARGAAAPGATRRDCAPARGPEVRPSRRRADRRPAPSR